MNAKIPQLFLEYEFYRRLGPDVSLPKVYFFGKCGKYNGMVMDLLGPNIEELFNLCGRQFSIKTVLLISIQLMYRIEKIHECGMVYRDMKPENVLIGRTVDQKENILHIVDYGLAKPYIDSETKKHISYSEHRSITGTVRYMSINAHQGAEQSRRDDMEATGYLMVYLLKRGTLPWMGLKEEDLRERYRTIGKMKENISLRKLCSEAPREFCTYLRYVRSLKFTDHPDYNYCRNLFRHCLAMLGLAEDNIFDWMLLSSARPTPQPSPKPAGPRFQQNKVPLIDIRRIQSIEENGTKVIRKSIKLEKTFSSRSFGNIENVVGPGSFRGNPDRYKNSAPVTPEKSIQIQVDVEQNNSPKSPSPPGSISIPVPKNPITFSMQNSLCIQEITKSDSISLHNFNMSNKSGGTQNTVMLVAELEKDKNQSINDVVLKDLNTLDVLKECVETLTIQTEHDKQDKREEQKIANTGSEQVDPTVSFQTLKSLELSKDIEKPGEREATEAESEDHEELIDLEADEYSKQSVKSEARKNLEKSDNPHIGTAVNPDLIGAKHPLDIHDLEAQAVAETSAENKKQLDLEIQVEPTDHINSSVIIKPRLLESTVKHVAPEVKHEKNNLPAEAEEKHVSFSKIKNGRPAEKKRFAHESEYLSSSEQAILKSSVPPQNQVEIVAGPCTCVPLFQLFRSRLFCSNSN